MTSSDLFTYDLDQHPLPAPAIKTHVPAILPGLKDPLPRAKARPVAAAAWSLTLPPT